METQKAEREHDAREALVFSGLELLTQEFYAFAKSAADSLPLDELRKSVRNLTEQVRALPKSEYVIIRKVTVSFPGLEREVAELSTALRDAGFSVT